MDITAINKYLQSAPRYRLVVLKDEMPPDVIPKFDIGKSISAYIISENLLHSKDLKMLVNAEFMRLFREIASNDTTFDNAISLCNFGIVFEKKLGLDMRTILKDLSRNYLMFIQWEGVVKDDRLCFLTSDSSNFIDLSEISHLTI